jgi:pyruvate/2-oxoglutarate/acetoin dehydrogenase E1 component
VSQNVLRMPRLSDSMSEATIVGWLKQPGEAFLRGEPLVEVETDKATVIYEAEADGLLAEILVPEGGVAALGEPIARLGGIDGDEGPRAPADAAPAATIESRNDAVTTIDFRTAVREALDEELAADDRVVFFGEDVAIAGGVFAVTPGLYEKYGRERVFDTPISELALAGAAFGSAISGLRPVVEIMFGDFLTLVMDSLVNQSTKYWFLTGEQVSVPLVIRSVVGAGGRFGAIHSQMPVSWFMGVPGLKIVTPATPGDAKGLLRSAIRDDNPVLFFEHKRLYGLTGDVDGDLVPIGVARIAREGTDVTIVSAMNGVHEALKAADVLAADGIAAEVIDLRTLRPLDIPTVLASVAKTNRIVVVEEGPLTGGWAGEVLARVTEEGLGNLDDAWRIATADSPVPYSPPLEDAFLPNAERIASEIRTRLR